MANRDIIFGIRITGDSSSAVSEAKKADQAFGDVSGGLKVVESAARSAESALGATMKQVTPQPMKEMAAAAHGAADALGRVSAANAGAKTLDQLGMTAGQTAQALRQLPMQFTDIFTSLAAGQPPMMVMLQQGGQLKDTFGGIAPAARAMGGYIAGLITPVSVAAAAVGALAVAYYQGAAEGDAFRKTIVLNGNAAGVTADQLGVMAGRVAEVAGTISNAADVLNKLAGTGKIAVGQIERVATAIVAMGQVGADVDKLIEKFAAMGEEPVKASLKLNEAYNYLTPKIYDQIRALAEQNKHEEAARLAQEKAAEAMRARAAEVQAKAGAMEKAWMAVRKAAGDAWDAMLNVGRADSLAVQIEKQRQLISEISSGETIGNIDVAQKHLKALEQAAAEQGKAAKADADRAAGMRTYVGLEKDVTAVQERGIKQTRTLSEALAEYREKLANIKALNPDSAMLDPKKVAAGEAAIREEYKKTARVRTGLTQGERVTEDWVKRIQVLQAETGVTKELTETHKAGIKIMTDFANGKLKLTAAEKARLPALVQQALLLDDANEAEKRARAEAEAMAKVQADLLDAERKNTDSLLAKVDAAKFEADTYGMTEESVYRLLSARTQDRIEMLSFGDANDALIAELKAQAKAYLDLADAAGAKASREAAKKATDDSKAAARKFADDLERTLTDSLMRGFESGKSFGQSFVDSIKNTLKTAALKASVQLVMSPVTGAIQSAYGLSGTGGAGGTSGLSNLLSTGNLIAGSSGVSAYTGAAGYLQLGSMASSFGTGLTAAAGGADLAAAVAAYEAAGMGATAASLSAGASAASALGGAAATVGSAISALSAAAPYLAIGLLAAQQLGVFNGPTYHHGGAYQADTAGGSTRLTNSTPGLAGFDLGWGAYNSDRSAAFDDAMQTMSFGIATQIADSIKKYGGDPSALKVSARFASDNSDYSVGALRVTNAADQTLFDLDRRYAAQAERGMQEFTADATRALVGALKATKLDDEFAAVFANVDPLTSSIEALNAALTQAAAIQQQVESIRTAIDTNFLSPSEQLDKAFSKLGKSVPETAASYEELVRAQDLNTSAGRDMAAALMSVYALWGQVKDSATQAAEAVAAQQAALYSEGQSAISTASDSLRQAYTSQRDEIQATISRLVSFSDAARKFRSSLLLGDMSPLNPQDRYLEAKTQLAEIAARAKAGDETALAGQEGAINAFLAASRTMFAGGAEYNADFAYVQRILDETTQATDASVDVAKQSLRELEASVSTLISIDAGVMTVADAIVGLREALLNATLSSTTTTTGAAINQAYQDLLGRQADIGGLSWYSQQAAGGMSLDQIQADIGGSPEARSVAISRLYQSILGRPADTAGLSWYASSGQSLQQIEASMRASEEFMRKIRGYASGGLHGGGVRLVGELGPELEVTGPARYWSYDQTRKLMGAGGASASAQELKALLEELRRLRDQLLEHQRAVVAATYDATARSADLISTRTEMAESRRAAAERYL